MYSWPYYFLVNKQQIIEQAKFTYSPSEKAFEKQIKTIEDQGQKQVDKLKTFKFNKEKLTIEDVIPKSALNNDEAIEELDRIKEMEKNVDREKLFYETNEYTHSSENFQTTKTFGKDIYNGTIMLKEANDYQIDLLAKIMYFKKNIKTKKSRKKNKKKNSSWKLI